MSPQGFNTIIIAVPINFINNSDKVISFNALGNCSAISDGQFVLMLFGPKEKVFAGSAQPGETISASLYFEVKENWESLSVSIIIPQDNNNEVFTIENV